MTLSDALILSDQELSSLAFQSRSVGFSCFSFKYVQVTWTPFVTRFEGTFLVSNPEDKLFKIEIYQPLCTPGYPSSHVKTSNAELCIYNKLTSRWNFIHKLPPSGTDESKIAPENGLSLDKSLEITKPPRDQLLNYVYKMHSFL